MEGSVILERNTKGTQGTTRQTLKKNTYLSRLEAPEFGKKVRFADTVQPTFQKTQKCIVFFFKWPCAASTKMPWSSYLKVTTPATTVSTSMP